MNVAINLNDMYNPTYKDEPFKYNISVLVSKVIVSANPNIARDFVSFSNTSECLTYTNQLRTHRPQTRIQQFIDLERRRNGLTDDQRRRKASCIRDWFKLALWYVRLKKASKGIYSTNLLEIERHAHYLNVRDPKRTVVAASTADYQPR